MSADDKFGDYDGQYVPEVLMLAIEELTGAYERCVLDNKDGFMDDFHMRLRDFGGRPTPLQCADRLSERYDRKVYLKHEDLLHDGTHRLNNALGQALLTKYTDKECIIVETGAGQHDTATAMVCAHLDMLCGIYIGERGINRQRPNVFRMELNGSEVNPVTAGRGMLKETISETAHGWATNVEDIHCVIDSVVGPHPFPSMVRDFQLVISEEARTQIREKLGRLPDAVVACVGGGSNMIDAFAEFVDDEETVLCAVEADGSTLEVDEEAGVAPNSALFAIGSEDILHDTRVRLLQDRDGQTTESHSMSSGPDYASVDPELAHLVGTDRVTAVNVDGGVALTAFHRPSWTEGIVPALGSAHAFGCLESTVGPDVPDAENADNLGRYIVANVSGCGDKGFESAIEETYKRDIDTTLNMDEFTGGL